ncbi:class I SAM-dependent methyltransferase [Enterococcus sp. DIV0876]|uniref:class I SAM-dependent methyltransferase n=1 Tax=Enterococcus sp. DIV0876 TaxID=2774633 RepID=UPI003D3006A2
MAKQEVGHNFLARLGKTKLRPGGIEATDWLIQQAKIDSQTKILEVACNMGTTMIHLAKTYGCEITGLDQSTKALEKAKQNIAKEQLGDKITVVQGNALKLPFDDGQFDIVINEAMLTMLTGAAKDKAINEYLRVLKPNGLLLTHDVCILDETSRHEILTGLSETIHVNVEPLTLTEWQACFADKGFTVMQKSGTMSLMDPIGMVRDEGLIGAYKIVHNGLKEENREQFKKMFTFFRKNKEKIGYVAHVNQKRG